MLAGEWFDPHDAELTADRDRATRLMHRLNVECCGHGDDYRTTLGELCPNVRGFIREPFHCDYGYNIHMGEGSFVNFDCVFLDLAPIRIGCGTLIGPKVQLLTAHHPFDAATRGTALEAGKPIVITTQVPHEGSDLAVYEVGRAAKALPGVLEAHDMTPEATAVKLMWVLGQTTDRAEAEKLFLTPVQWDIL